MTKNIVEQLKSLGLSVEEMHTDVAVVGGGGAASRAALSARLAGAEVLVLAKAPLGTGGSWLPSPSNISLKIGTMNSSMMTTETADSSSTMTG